MLLHMRKLSLLLLILVVFKVNAQEGIKFNQAKNWKAALEKAAQEDKLIFVDCYTDWCMPCKWMDVNAFTAAPIAEFYNKNFINMKVDMEKGEGIELRKKYSVQSFPTFLFINQDGEVIHRTGSRMPIEEFLDEGKKATSPTANLSYVKKKYDNGERSLPFMMDYYSAASKSDRSLAEKLGSDITSRISDEELNTKLGWKVITALARSETDRLGAYYLKNQNAYAAWSTKEDRAKLEDRLVSYTMYGLIRTNDEATFMKKLKYFSESASVDRRTQGYMLEAEFYLEQRRSNDYKNITNKALENDLKDQAEKLSFLARRANISRPNDPIIMDQAYILAKRATILQPNEYSIQGTFSEVCYTLKKKEEALKAAKIARLLADDLTSKIQNIAQKVIEKIELL